jgi:hypothetical protein
MNRPFTAHSPYSLTPTERISTVREEPPVDDGYGSDEPTYAHDFSSGYRPDYDSDYDAEYDAEYDEYADYDEERIDRRWMWIGGIAGVILFIAVVTTGVILGGGDSGSVAATVGSAAPSTTAAPVTTAPSATAAPSMPSLPAETVTTVSPTMSPSVATPTPTVAAPPVAAPPPAAASPRTITYMVTGSRPLIDLVTVIYTDQRGALQTDVNVALPWVKSVTLDPGVELKSVTATSVTGQLNCSITDASGALITAQNNNSMIATCTQ